VLELPTFASTDQRKILDLGAGTGLLSAKVAAAFPRTRLTLFDPASEMLAAARLRLKPFAYPLRPSATSVEMSRESCR
jgi:tRNA (cmo5U34)-methyltransferase